MIWWPLLDQIDWDGALLHRVGKVHEVGLFNLKRRSDGTLERKSTPLIKLFRQYVASGEESVGALGEISYPSPEATDEQLPPISDWIQPALVTDQHLLAQLTSQVSQSLKSGNGNGNGGVQKLLNFATAPVKGRLADPVPGLAGEPGMMQGTEVGKKAKGLESLRSTEAATSGYASAASVAQRDTDRYGIVVFSHLRWGFVWQ